MEISISSTPPDPPISRYGKRRAARACTHCKAAKTKCIMHPGDEESCERCSHFTLECVMQAPVVRKKRQAKSLRVNDLEQKLDNIVTLLTNPQSQPQPQIQQPQDRVDEPRFGLWSSPSHHQFSAPSTGSISTSPIPISDPTLVNRTVPYSLHSSSQEQQERRPSNVSSRVSRLSVSNVPLIEEPFRENLNQDDYEAYLSIYQTQMACYFPFVVIPTNISGQQLRQTQPFLWKAILLVASRHRCVSQNDLGKEILETLSEKLLLRGEKSLDLLQGLLVYIAWGNFWFHNNAQMTYLLQLAVALIVELGLDKMPRLTPDSQKSLIEATNEPQRPRSAGPSLEERRAFTGGFYLSSIVFQCYKKITSLRQTPFLEQCCKALDEASEYPGDSYLTHLVRLQTMVSRSGHGTSFDETEPSWALAAPIGMYLKSLQRELNEFRQNLPEHLQHTTLLMHYHSIEISLLEIGLFDPTLYTNQTFNHLDQLFSCLNATKSFFETFFQLQPSTYVSLPFVAWAQLASAIVATSRLLLFECQDWDLEHARRVADFPGVLQRVAERIEEACEGMVIDGGGVGDNVFVQYAQRVRWVKGWFEAKGIEGLSKDSSGGGIDGETWKGDDGTGMGGDFLCLDEMFWQEFVDEWGNIPMVGNMPSL